MSNPSNNPINPNNAYEQQSFGSPQQPQPHSWRSATSTLAGQLSSRTDPTDHQKGTSVTTTYQNSLSQSPIPTRSFQFTPSVYQSPEQRVTAFNTFTNNNPSNITSAKGLTTHPLPPSQTPQYTRTYTTRSMHATNNPPIKDIDSTSQVQEELYKPEGISVVPNDSYSRQYEYRTIINGASSSDTKKGYGNKYEGNVSPVNYLLREGDGASGGEGEVKGRRYFQTYTPNKNTIIANTVTTTTNAYPITTIPPGSNPPLAHQFTTTSYHPINQQRYQNQAVTIMPNQLSSYGINNNNANSVQSGSNNRVTFSGGNGFINHNNYGYVQTQLSKGFDQQQYGQQQIEQHYGQQKQIEQQNLQQERYQVIDQIQRPQYQKLYGIQQTYDNRRIVVDQDPPTKRGVCCGPLCWLPLVAVGVLAALFGMLCGLGVVCPGGGKGVGVTTPSITSPTLSPTILPTSTQPSTTTPATTSPPTPISPHSIPPTTFPPSSSSLQPSTGLPTSLPVTPSYIPPISMAPNANPIEPIVPTTNGSMASLPQYNASLPAIPQPVVQVQPQVVSFDRRVDQQWVDADVRVVGGSGVGGGYAYQPFTQQRVDQGGVVVSSLVDYTTKIGNNKITIPTGNNEAQTINTVETIQTINTVTQSPSTLVVVPTNQSIPTITQPQAPQPSITTTIQPHIYTITPTTSSIQASTIQPMAVQASAVQPTPTATTISAQTAQPMISISTAGIQQQIITADFDIAPSTMTPSVIASTIVPATVEPSSTTTHIEPTTSVSTMMAQQSSVSPYSEVSSTASTSQSSSSTLSPTTNINNSNGYIMTTSQQLIIPGAKTTTSETTPQETSPTLPLLPSTQSTASTSAPSTSPTIITTATTITPPILESQSIEIPAATSTSTSPVTTTQPTTKPETTTPPPTAGTTSNYLTAVNVTPIEEEERAGDIGATSLAAGRSGGEGASVSREEEVQQMVATGAGDSDIEPSVGGNGSSSSDDDTETSMDLYPEVRGADNNQPSTSTTITANTTTNTTTITTKNPTTSPLSIAPQLPATTSPSELILASDRASDLTTTIPTTTPTSVSVSPLLTSTQTSFPVTTVTPSTTAEPLPSTAVITTLPSSSSSSSSSELPASTSIQFLETVIPSSDFVTSPSPPPESSSRTILPSQPNTITADGDNIDELSDDELLNAPVDNEALFADIEPSAQ